MSTKRTGKTKQRARETARTTANSRRNGDLAMFDGTCREVLSTQGRDVLRSGDPLQAEMWASYLVGMLGGLPLVGEPDSVAAIGGRFVSVARRARTPQALVCLRALAAVATEPLRRRAQAAAREVARLGGGAPAWSEAIGTARPTHAWRASDRFGDQDAVMIGFAYPDGTEHSLIVLIDHPLGGIAKEACVLGPLAEVVADWADDPDFELVEEPVEVAAGRVIEAMAWTARTIDPDITEDYEHTAALVAARLGPIAVAPPDVEPLAAEERESVVKAFLADPAGDPYAHDPDGWFLLNALVDFRCDYHGRDPLRWSAGAALLFLLDFVPHKLSADRDHLARMPEVLRAWVPWAGSRAGLPSHLLEETLETIDEIEEEFVSALDDEDRWGPAKRIAMLMRDDEVDFSDDDAVDGWLASHGAAAAIPNVG